MYMCMSVYECMCMSVVCVVSVMFVYVCIHVCIHVCVCAATYHITFHFTLLSLKRICILQLMITSKIYGMVSTKCK